MIDNAGSDKPMLSPYAYSPEPEQHRAVTTRPAAHVHARKQPKRAPPKLDTKTVDRVTSMSSSTSAGEDVLAAWAELGGGRDALAFKRRGF